MIRPSRLVAFFACVMITFLPAFGGEIEEQSGLSFRAAVSIEDGVAKIAVPSGTDFTIVDALAGALTENGFSTIELHTNATGRVPSVTDTWLLLQVVDNKGNLNTSATVPYACTSSLVARLTTLGVQSVSLVATSALLDDNHDWRSVAR